MGDQWFQQSRFLLQEQQQQQQQQASMMMQQQQQPRLSPGEGLILLTQSLIEPCILKGYTKWEIVAELSQTHPQIKREMVLEVWNKLEMQNPGFFNAYDKFLKLKAQVSDFNEMANKFSQDLKNEARVSMPQSLQPHQFYVQQQQQHQEQQQQPPHMW